MVVLQLVKRQRISSWVVALCIFLLVREWLLPLTVISDTAELQQFYMITAGVIILDLLLYSRWLSFVLKVVGVFTLIYLTYFVTPFFGMEWIAEIILRLQMDLPLISQQNWVEMSPISRNLLFDLLLVAVVSLTTFLVLEQRQGLWFVFLTGAYLATLDTFLPYEAAGAIIRTIAIGFFMIAVLTLTSVQRQSHSSGRRLSYWRGLLVPLMVISLTVGVAYAAPKSDPVWPDPVPFLTGKSEGAGGLGVNKVGYDNNDERLGGPFVQDDGAVFRAYTNKKSYWRGDSKDIYTGAGWEKSPAEVAVVFQPREAEWDQLLFSGTETEEVYARLDFTSQYPQLFYPGQLRQVLDVEPNRVILLEDVNHQHFQTVVSIPGGSRSNRMPVQPVPMSHYSVVAEVPVISETAITNSTAEYPADIMEKYLQLPPSLPARVKALAEEITAQEQTPYKKIKAIEFFLKNSGQYRYETTDVPVTEEEQDFVDQFLFESKRGYCDHFSTSMVVMLRTIGIPARWVKGFAPGQEINRFNDGMVELEVRNQDAHSWVEVYVADMGWIPFEPTPSFSAPVTMNYDLPTQFETEAIAPVELPQRERDDYDPTEMLDEQGPTGTGVQHFLTGKQVLMILLPLLIVALIGWLNRSRITLWYLHRQLQTYGEDRFREKYSSLLRMCEQLFGPRQPGETLREYLHRINLKGETGKDLRSLTHMYERTQYGQKPLTENVKELAHKMMERISQQLKP